MEGHIPTFGDVVWVNHDLLGAGQQFSGTVAKVDGDVLTLSRDVELPGEHWLMILRNRLGEPSQPLNCEWIEANKVRVLDTLPDIVTEPYKEPTHFLIGQGSQYALAVKVTSITPEDDDRIVIAGCIESDYVHTADQGELPPPPPDLVPPPPGLVVEGLIATQGGTTLEPVIYLSWEPAHNADYYVIEFSQDERKTWQPAGTGHNMENSHSFSCDVLEDEEKTYCRVAAMSAVRGDWAEVSFIAGKEFDKPGRVTLRLKDSNAVLTDDLLTFTGNALDVEWDEEPAAARYELKVLSEGVQRRHFYVELGTQAYSYHWQDARHDGAGRELTIQIRAQNAAEVFGEWSELSARNEPPATPDNVSVTGLLDTLQVKCSPNTDEDIRELRVYGEQESGVEPSIANLLAAENTWLVSVPVPVNTTWFVKIAWVDNWGAIDLNFTGEFEATAERITGTVIGECSIDTPQLNANSVKAAQIDADSITGDNIIGGSITAKDAVFENGAIENAAIGNIIHSNDYEEGKEGWIIDKCGYAEFQNILARGRVTGSEVVGSVIEGSYIIGRQDLLMPTEADEGSGSTRYLTFTTPFNVSDQRTVSFPQIIAPVNDSVSRQTTLSLDIVSASYNNGANEIVADNFYRYKHFLIAPEIQVFSNSSMSGYDMDFIHSASLTGPTQLNFTVNAIDADQSNFLLNASDFNRGDNTINLTKGSIRLHGTINIHNASDFGNFKVFRSMHI